VGVEAFLERSAERLPDKTAVVCGAERRSFREIDERANALARRLRDGGLQTGDRVAICLENSIDAVVAMFGVLKAGGAFFVVQPRTRPDGLRHLLRDSGAFGLVARPSMIAVVDVPVRTFAPDTSRDPRPVDCRHGDEDLAALIYTSGSTGAPKGVMLTHHNMTAAADAICSYLRLTDRDVLLNGLPLAFTYGLGQVTTAFRSAATLVLERSAAYPRALVDTMIRERITGLPIVPTLATQLLQLDLARFAFPDLRYITNAAAALPIATLKRLRRAFPSAQIFSMYGQTECQRISYLPPDQIDVRPASVGVPIPGTEAFVVDECGQRVPPGVVGELVVRGPHVMKGYWNQPATTARVLREGATSGDRLLYTGDLFHTDADGYLYFVSRTDDIIKSRGEKIAPRQIEDVIARLPGVADVAVYGVPDEILGEAVSAAVTLSAGATLTRDAIQRECLERLGPSFVPRTVVVEDRLPTTATGKVSRRALREVAVARAKVCA